MSYRPYEDILNSTDLGTFTGSIIEDNRNVKEALQDLETELDLTVTNLYSVVSSLSGKLDIASFSAEFDAALSTKNSDDISEGTTNLYYTSARQAAIQSYADAIGTSANAYADSVGVDAKAYADSVGVDAKSYADSVGVSANAYADSVGIDAKSYADSVGVDAKSYADSVGVDANAYTDSEILTKLTNKLGENNGIATLDSGGKVPVSQLPSAIMEYKGTWDALNNVPALADGNPPNAPEDTGHAYIVSVAGTRDLGSGSITFSVGDFVILNASLVWEKTSSSNAVVSVNGQTGVVVLDSDDISEGAANLYYTSARQAAIQSYADAKVEDAIVDGITSKAPSQNAVYDALAAKLNLSGGTMSGDITMDGHSLKSGSGKSLFLRSDQYGGIVAELGASILTYHGRVDITSIDNDIMLDSGSKVINVTTSRIRNVTDPQFNQDAATKKYVDDAVAAASGAVDSVNGQTGVVVLDSDDISEGTTNLYYTSARQAAIQSYADAKVEDVIVDGVTAKAPSQNAVYDALATKLSLSGGTITGVLTLSSDPITTDLQAATKKYVDDAVAAASGAVDSVNGQVGIVVLDAADLNYTQADPTDWTVANNSSIAATLDEVGQRLLDLETSGGGDTKKVLISSADTTEGYVQDKIVGATNKITATKLNSGANEQLQISIGTDVFDKVSDDSDDITEGAVNRFYTPTKQTAIEDYVDAAVAIEAAARQTAIESYADAAVASEATARASQDALLQGQIDNKLNSSAVGVSVASLVGGKVPVDQLPNAVMEYKGTWDALNNVPSLADGNPPNAPEDAGHVYIVSVAGTRNLGSGSITFGVGDFVILNVSLVWEKAASVSTVTSVAGRSGDVVITSSDLSDFSTAARSAVISSSITNGDTTHSPSGDAVFDALALKQDSITGAATTVTSSDLTASKALVSDASGKIAASSVTSTEIGYVSGVTSAIQTQLNGKQATVTGGATTITSSDLTASRALVSDASGKVAVSAVTSTQLGYVSGVTSAIQTQLNAKAPTASPALTGTPTAPTSTDYDPTSSSTTIGTVAHTIGLRREEILTLTGGDVLLTSIRSTLVLTGTLSGNVTLRMPVGMSATLNATLHWNIINKATMGAFTITASPPAGGATGTSVSIPSGFTGQIFANTAQATPSPIIINVSKIDFSSLPVSEIALPTAYQFPSPLSNLYDLTGLTALSTTAVRGVEVSYFLAATPTSAYEYGEIRFYWNGSSWLVSNSNPALTSVTGASSGSNVNPIVKSASHGTSTAIYPFVMTNTSGTTWKLSINTLSFVYAAGHKLSYTYRIIYQ